MRCFRVSFFLDRYSFLLFVARAIVKKVVPAVYKQQKAEGTFRYDHAWLRTHSESVVFCGVEAVEGRERDRLGASFDAVVHARCVCVYTCCGGNVVVVLLQAWVAMLVRRFGSPVTRTVLCRRPSDARTGSRSVATASQLRRSPRLVQ